MTCTPGGGNAYVLSNLLRGRFGTEWAMGLHVIGDTVVLLDNADLQWLALSSNAISQARLYRAITFGNDIGTDSDRSFTYSAVNLRPLEPIALTGACVLARADWSLTWLCRTRSGGEWRDGMDVDLGETSERYEVDIYASVKRTLATTSPAAIYSRADQVTDCGSNQTTLYLKIYQLSDSIGSDQQCGERNGDAPGRIIHDGAGNDRGGFDGEGEGRLPGQRVADRCDQQLWVPGFDHW